MDALSLNRYYQQIKNRFTENGIDNAALDARLLLCHALELSHEAFVLQGAEPLDEAQKSRVENLIEQRLKGRPVAKIIGYKEFYGRDFKTCDQTLDPRPDSETLIETVLRYVDQAHDRNAALRILDLGTGTGCLALTLLAELPQAMAVAVDQSADALAVAQENAHDLGLAQRVHLIQSDWFQHVEGVFDIIISNPPYIPAGDIAGLAIEVREYDPLSALVGGADGLDPYRLIIPQLYRFMVKGGLAAFELGQGQDQDVATILGYAGFADIRKDHDLAGIVRVVSGIF